MNSDHELLTNFVETHSEPAFRELVERHLDLVHSIASRITTNSDLARDVAQNVFTKLATQPDTVPPGIEFLAWLHQTTRHKAIDLVRSENRRRRREQIALLENTMPPPPNSHDWSDLEPVIDDVLSHLPERDRSLVISRFYQGRTHADSGAILGISEDAARARTRRALNKLKDLLGRRGISTTTAALAATLPANAVNAAPHALAPTISSNAVAAASTVTSAPLLVGIATTFKSHALAAVALTVALPLVAIQFVHNTRQNEEIRALRSAAETELSAAPAPSDSAGLRTGPQSKTYDRADLAAIFAGRDPFERMEQFLSFARSLAPHEIETAIQDLRASLPSWDFEGKLARQLLLGRWAKTDPIASFASLEKLDATQRAEDSIPLIAGLALKDPQRAHAWLADPENTLTKSPMMGHFLAGAIATQWVRQNPEAALAWAKTLPADQRAGAYHGALGILGGSEPARAAAIATRELGPNEDRAQIIGGIAHSWGQREPEKALRWATSLSPDESTAAVRESLEGWAQNHPKAAVAYVDALPFDRKQESLGAVAGAFARSAPAEAANWIAAQPEGLGKAEAMRDVIYQWTESDPAAASTWLGAQSECPSRDQGIVALAVATFDSDPAASITWAASITDPEIRSASIDRGIREWVIREPERATHWLESSGVLTESDWSGLAK